VTALDRTFGMELEFTNRGNDIARALHAAGLSMQRTQHSYHCTCDHCRYYFGQMNNLFKVQSDSSCGGEVISSPLMWGWTDPIGPSYSQPDPWLLMQELERIMGLELDVGMDQHCGMHVHVGARDLSGRQLGRLNELVEHHEATLFRLACGRNETHRGYSNRFTYCRPLSAFHNPLELKALEKAKSAAVRDSAISKQKYVAANLMPLGSLGTVEFRLFEATRVAWRMRLYTKLSVALVERAKRPRSPMGKPLYLGETGDDSNLEVFLEDLEHGAGVDFIDDTFKEDAHRQWTAAPARWQRPVALLPLEHYDSMNCPTTDPRRAVSCSDGHGNVVPLEGDAPPEFREVGPNVDRWSYREDPRSYVDDFDDDPVERDPDEDDDWSEGRGAGLRQAERATTPYNHMASVAPSAQQVAATIRRIRSSVAVERNDL